MRARIRTVKPEFFQHEALYDLERSTNLPLRTAYVGLWCVADREGRFEWRPRMLKANVLPFDDVDFTVVLEALERGGFIVRYRHDGQELAYIPSFLKHQCPNTRESASALPTPAHARTRKHVHARARIVGTGTGMGTERERNGNGKESTTLVAPKNGATGQELIAELRFLHQSQHLNGAARGVKVKLVFSYWAAKWDHPLTRLDGKRASQIAKRLQENHDNVSELLYVVDGAKRDTWEERPRFAGIEQLFKDRGSVEKFAGLCPEYQGGVVHPMAQKYLPV